MTIHVGARVQHISTGQQFIVMDKGFIQGETLILRNCCDVAKGEPYSEWDARYFQEI